MNPRLTRRSFLKVSIAGGAAVFLPWRAGASRVQAAAPAGLLDPHDISQFATPLLVPPAMPRAGKIPVRGGRAIDYYDVSVRQFPQQILPAGMPPTTVWGYGPRTAQGGPMIFHAPSLTIEAKHGTPVRVRWSNELRTSSRWTPRSTGRTHPVARPVATCGPSSPRRPVRTSALCRS
jgi:spore coat protein A